MKSIITAITFFIFLVFGNVNISKATHFAGADITYTCLSANKYQVTLTFYRDCSGIPAPDPAKIKFTCQSDNNYTFETDFFMVQGTGNEITNSCSVDPSSCNGGSYNNYGIAEYVYQGVVTLPHCADWEIGWFSNARNPITTLIGQPSWYVPAFLNNKYVPSNSSPKFSQKPIIVACLGQKICYNPGAVDSDGDSLSYDFYTPKVTPDSILVTYKYPYSFKNFLHSSSGISLNSVTGDICFTPTQILNTITGIRVTEWRKVNGVMIPIGQVFRDMQLKIVACDNQIPKLSGMDTLLKKKYSPKDTVYYLEKYVSSGPIAFHINGYDSDILDTINKGNTERFSISWNNGIHGASFTPYYNGTDSAYAEFLWQPGLTDVGAIPKCFVATIKDEACPYNGLQSYSYCIKLKRKRQSTNALHFDGVDDYVQTNCTGVEGDYPRLIEAWIKTTSDTGQHVIVDWGNNAKGEQFTFGLDNGAPRIDINGAGLTSKTIVSDNVWHHLAIKYNFLDPIKYSLYIDGNIDTSFNLPIAIFTGDSAKVRIGNSIDNTMPYKGLIDEVRIWLGYKTNNEISENKDFQFCSRQKYLMAYYNFNHGVAGGNNIGINTLKDYSGNANDGKLVSFSCIGNSSNWVIGKSMFQGFGTQSVKNVKACNSYVSSIGNTYTSSNIYIDTFTNAYGCDSIVILNLIVNKIDTTVSRPVLAGGMLGLKSNETNARYQWLDCDNNFEKILGATQQMFVPSVDGKYAVELTKTDCIDTSACYEITGVGIEHAFKKQGYKLYPNPGKGKFYVELDMQYSKVKVDLYNLSGQKLFSKTFHDTQLIEINPGKLPAGVYLLKLSNSKGVFIERLIVE